MPVLGGRTFETFHFSWHGHLGHDPKFQKQSWAGSPRHENMYYYTLKF
jgi:hypothetical protein